MKDQIYWEVLFFKHPFKNWKIDNYRHWKGWKWNTLLFSWNIVVDTYLWFECFSFPIYQLLQIQSAFWKRQIDLFAVCFNRPVRWIIEHHSSRSHTVETYIEIFRHSAIELLYIEIQTNSSYIHRAKILMLGEKQIIQKVLDQTEP